MKRKMVSLLLAATLVLPIGVVPVYADTVVTPANPIHNCGLREKVYCDAEAEWDYIYFGEYPQTQIMAEDVSEAMKTAMYDANGDAEVEGQKYRRIEKTKKHNSAYWGEGEYLYFKWEPIRWRVLQNNGETLYVMADRALDCQQYHTDTNNLSWEASSLRVWLNESFYNMAFDAEEQSAIVIQTVTNKGSQQEDFGSPDGHLTEDKIYLLSEKDVLLPEYGFCTRLGSFSEARTLRAYDYAEAVGVDCETDARWGYNQSCEWWLRTIANNGKDSSCGGFGGEIGLCSAYYDTLGVVPVLHIDINSSAWTMADETPILLEKIQFVWEYEKIAVGETMAFENAIRTFPDKTTSVKVEWKSSKPSCISINKDSGFAKVKKGGKTVTITATATDGSGVVAKYVVKTVKHKVTNIKFKNAKKKLKTGQILKLKTKIMTTGKNANTKLEWTSSNPEYATVNQKGKVTALEAGKGHKVTITASATDGTNTFKKIKIKIK